MIKERDLVPGKVITSVDRAWGVNGQGVRGYVEVVTAWMIIGFQDQIRRRHSKMKAPREGWHVLLLKFGDADRVLHDVVITPSEMTSNKWKRLF